MNLNDRIRISDSDRDRVATQLRDYYAEGRLTSEELDERVTAALNARTAGDLRRLMTDLPAAAPAAGSPGTPSYGAPYGGTPWAGRAGWAMGRSRRRGPRVLPILLLLLVAAILLPGGWVFFALLKVFLLFWLLVAIAGMAVGLVFRHKARRFFRDRAGQWQQWQGQNWRGPRDW
ncbi:MAG: DUF1707 domain-containing protein [Actinobacteria bacterium]|nr:DUF1707 domain-containing protein [Actinomycetota bacterium]